MRFLASWWERFPKRETIPALIAFLALTGGFGFGHLYVLIKVVGGSAGWVWD